MIAKKEYNGGSRRPFVSCLGRRAVSGMVAVALGAACLFVQGCSADTPQARVGEPDDGGSLSEAADSTPRAIVLFSTSCPGLDADGTRIPLVVRGTTAEGEAIDRVCYIEPDGTGLNVAAGTYELTVSASPISSSGTLYRLPASPISLAVGDPELALGIVSVEDSLTLEPLSDGEYTEEGIAAAVECARGDEARANVVDDLAERARQHLSYDASSSGAGDGGSGSSESGGGLEAVGDRMVSLRGRSFIMPAAWQGKVDAVQETEYSTSLMWGEWSVLYANDTTVAEMDQLVSYGEAEFVESYALPSGYTAYLYYGMLRSVMLVVEGPAGSIGLSTEAVHLLVDANAAPNASEISGYEWLLASVTGLSPANDPNQLAVTMLKVCAENVVLDEQFVPGGLQCVPVVVVSNPDEAVSWAISTYEGLGWDCPPVVECTGEYHGSFQVHGYVDAPDFTRTCFWYEVFPDGSVYNSTHLEWVR